MAENFKFGVIRVELIQDRLMVEIHDNALPYHLQREAELTLDKAKHG